MYPYGFGESSDYPWLGRNCKSKSPTIASAVLPTDFEMNYSLVCNVPAEEVGKALKGMKAAGDDGRTMYLLNGRGNTALGKLEKLFSQCLSTLKGCQPRKIPT